MSFVLDVILVVIFAAFVFAAVKKGFMLSLLELVAVIAALALSYQFSPVVAQAAYDGVVEESLIETVEGQIDENFNLSSTTKQAEVILDAMPEFMVSFASSVGVELKQKYLLKVFHLKTLQQNLFKMWHNLLLSVH